MTTRSRTLLAAAVAAALPALAQAKDPLAIEGVKVETKTSTVGKSKGNEYLRVSFTATASEAVEPRTQLRLVVKATVGEETKTDDFSLFGKMDAIAPGSSKALSAPLFMTEGLGGSPSKAQLTFQLVKTLKKEGPTFAQFCWSGGSKVAPGPCE